MIKAVTLALKKGEKLTLLKGMSKACNRSKLKKTEKHLKLL